MSLRSASTCLPGCKSGVRLGGNPDNFYLQNLITEAKASRWHALPKAPTCRTLQSGSSETSESSYIIHWANAATLANRLFFRWSTPQKYVGFLLVLAAKQRFGRLAGFQPASLDFMWAKWTCCPCPCRLCSNLPQTSKIDTAFYTACAQRIKWWNFDHFDLFKL